MRLNLQATIMTLALTVTAVPASLAGMNIPNGFEAAHPSLFWGVTGRGLRSSTFRLHESTFCGIRWVHKCSPVY